MSANIWNLEASGNILLKQDDPRIGAFRDLFSLGMAEEHIEIIAPVSPIDQGMISGTTAVWKLLDDSPPTDIRFQYSTDTGIAQKLTFTRNLDALEQIQLPGISLQELKEHLVLTAMGETPDAISSFSLEVSGSLILDSVSIPFKVTGLNAPPYTLKADFDIGQGPSPDDLIELLGKATDLEDWLPEELHQDAIVEVQELTCRFDPSDEEKLTYVSTRLSFGEGKSWPLIPEAEFEFLTIGGLWANLRIDHPLESEYRFPTVQVGGVFAIDDAHIEITARWPDLAVQGSLRAGDSIEVGALLEKFSLPISSLPGGEDTLGISSLSFLAEPLGTTKSFNFLCTVDNVWKIAITTDEALSIDQLSLYLAYQSGDEGGLSGTLSGKFTIAGIDLYMSADFQSGGLLFTGQAAMQNPISIGEIIADLADRSGLGISLPSALKTATVSNIELNYDTSTKGFKFTFEAAVTDPLTADIIIDLELNNDGAGNYHTYFSGHLTLGTGDDQRTFDLIFDQQSQAAPAGDDITAPSATGATTPSTTSNTLIALYQKPDGDHLSIGNLVSTVINDTVLVEDLNKLTFSLKNALLVFEHDGDGETSDNKYLFAVDVDFGIDLSGLGNLPIIGQQLAGKGPLELAFQPIIDSGFTDLSAVKALLPDGSPAIPDTLSGAFALATTITFGDFNKVINLGMSSDAKKAIDPGLESTPNATANGSTGPTDTAPTQSTDINKNFGALSISRLNLAYESGTIKLGIDGALKIGPLEVALFGLGASYTIEDSAFSAKLDGLMLDFEKPPLTIAGGFFRIDRSPKPPDYVGELNLKMEEFGLLLLGAFSQMEDGHPAMFLYLFVDAPLGGPIFFFVEGLAFGFGYNRRLEVPPIDKMYKFPLVADAIGASPQQASATGGGTPAQKADLLKEKFQMLADYIYPEEGQYFLAVGLKFNSFKIVDCFALLSVGFGEELDFAIMGIARVTTPPESPIPTTNVEMAFSVHVDPAEGLVAANGILTPNTYVYNPFVHIDGGFAFSAWMFGEHEGDFVVTVGGYNPVFDVPDHYPSRNAVPRLRLSWQFSDYIAIGGEVYFAITPKAMMLGGALFANFTSNPPHIQDQSLGQQSDQPGDDTKNGDDDKKKSKVDVEASFIAGVDFLIHWEPFYYEADAYVEIYAKASMDTFLGTFSKSLSARADVRTWGAYKELKDDIGVVTGTYLEFAGTASIEAKVFGIKFHYDVDFGVTTAQQPPKKLEWDTFASKFLPTDFAQDALSLVIKGGLVKTIKASERTDGSPGDLWIVNPKDLELVVSSLFPISDGTDDIYANPVAGPESELDSRGQIIAQKPAVITSTLEYTTTLNGVANSFFQFIPVNKNYPDSLWTKNGDYATALPLINGDQHINAKGGYRITPLIPPKALATHSFHVSNLSYEEPPGPLPLNLFPPQNFQFQPRAEADAQTVDPKDAEVAKERSELLTEMQFDPVQDVQLKTNMFDMFTERPEVYTYSPK